VSYGLRDPQAAYRAALMEAMSIAQANARVLADAAHERITRVKTIATYSSAPVYRPQVMARMAAPAPTAAPQFPTEILPTNLTVTAQVNVVYVIAP
jgi:uncharacterized protein YggE